MTHQPPPQLSPARAAPVALWLVLFGLRTVELDVPGYARLRIDPIAEQLTFPPAWTPWFVVATGIATAPEGQLVDGPIPLREHIRVGAGRQLVVRLTSLPAAYRYLRSQTP